MRSSVARRSLVEHPPRGLVKLMKVRALKAFASPVAVVADGEEFECVDDLAAEWILVGLVERVLEVTRPAERPIEVAVTRKR